MSKPVAVLISDVHYNLHTLELADAAMRQAVYKANYLEVPLIVAGDLHDSKANMRAECINAMLATFDLLTVEAYILVGNHDKINEKSSEHSLNFLSKETNLDVDGYTSEFGRFIIDKPGFVNSVAVNRMSTHLIPYQSNPDDLKNYLKRIDKGSTIIIHQGIQGSNSGDYIQDKSAITKEDVEDFRVISGHYHARQDIKCGRPRKGAVGLFSYIGNPYTLNFAEANDPEKGYQILMDDGLLEFVPTKLRKHVVIDTPVYDLVAIPYIHKPGDLLWFKVRDSKEELSTINKQLISANYGIEDGFKLELIPTDKKQATQPKQSSKVEQLDGLIERSATSTECKERLKQLWRDYERD